MKTFLFFAVLLGISSFVVAQTKKGDRFLSGSVGVNLLAPAASKSGYSSTTTFGANFHFSQTKFFKDNWAFRWGLGYSGGFSDYKSSGFEMDFPTSQSSHSVSLSGSWLYFYGQNRWRVFAGLGLNLAQDWSKSSVFMYDADSQNTLLVYPDFMVGGLYFLSPKWALSVSADVNSFPINTAGLNIGLIYAPKGKLTENEPTQLSTFQKGGSIWGLGFGIISNVSTGNQAYPNQTKTGNFQTLSVSYGRLIRDRLVLGGSIGVSSNVSEVRLPGYYKSYNTIFSLGSYIKKYYSTNHLTAFGSLSVAYDLNSRGTASSFSNSNSNTITLGAEAGLAYVVSNRFFVEASLANVRLSRTTDYDYVFYNLSASGAFSPSLRVQYVFH